MMICNVFFGRVLLSRYYIICELIVKKLIEHYTIFLFVKN